MKKYVNKQPKSLSKTARFFRRYWYWFVAVPLLLVVSFVWLYLLGVFDTTEKEPVTLSSSSPETIHVLAESLYRFGVTASDGSAVTYTSSDTTVAEVNENGIVYARIPGSCTITATAGKTSKKLYMLVSGYTIKWFTIAGDTFTEDDLLVSINELNGVALSLSYDATDDCVSIASTGGGHTFTINGIGSNPLYEEYTYFPVGLYGMVQVGYDENGEDPLYQTVELGEVLIYIFTSESRKNTEQEKYNLSMQETPLESETRIDETKEILCLNQENVIPTFSETAANGMLSFYVEDCSVPYLLKQAGTFMVSAKTTCYLRIYIGDTLYKRYKVIVNPSEISRSYSLNDLITLDEIQENAPSDIASFSASDRSLVPQYENKELIGFLCTEISESGELSIFGKDQYDHIIFRAQIYVYENIDYGEDE